MHFSCPFRCTAWWLDEKITGFTKGSPRGIPSAHLAPPTVTTTSLTVFPTLHLPSRDSSVIAHLRSSIPSPFSPSPSTPCSLATIHLFSGSELPPYNLKAFNLRINFPREYPLRPPTVIFTTPIYHPNVDLEGRVCLPIISNQHWNPRTKASRVLEDLNLLVNRLDLNEPMRLELAQQLKQTPELFYRRAEEHTLEFGEHRPS
ncbi:ubiquitin/ISG15-conjugating enzyme E2 L6 isoform X1 [Artibeus jamaicensis]|uniref:ubiquitin/ISG15-conjugating enzyme E2 L6 isoform X1 n=1 Tax=Artibeus jamaicensis TaxID=9417 RepID=UPI00235AF1EF|nr:ubiquitin/ISG15-conjugating enzyme E2 L6 isoform X1 [Artibeus jamaicensis]XP_053515111.1 ubiquitin/ISG15-conjugating enzyme E2 L6 isoform X1 [Artibeus jamaicensis]XP_053515112.1 ubiquitin/ISG15-conjugating enzyme E2 L6 isoform X1 [Artibeus jamaicensis]XP_053515113.1 ubiquitin/ISG15-conjugating enzyme E2 L6 isoform X1 [Artibeus jamaicensis]XP_053515114.1 ubiquitin/ISG15-conjugating enzyme E2 L6 isoform X1 [Artibeus jamaicensis]XP_053515115.1 ubiquitin/ISG15-conjugating enzyme E2 L6 isoform X